MPTAVQKLSDDMAHTVEAVGRSLVHIRDGRRGAGAGSIWHPRGLIVTNAHVVAGRSVQITLPGGREITGRLLARDPATYLAALSVDAADLPAITLADSRLLRPGEIVLAMGHPWGVAGAASAGVVIGVGRDFPGAPSSVRDWIAASLSLRPGHSGGPMMDARGRLVGINTMITGPQVAMAVPVHVVKAFLQGTLRSQGPGR